MVKSKIVRLTTVPISMNIIHKGQLAFMNQYFEVIGVTGRDAKHFPAIKDREGVKMYDIEMARTIALLKDLKALWQLFHLFRQIKPAIVHTHTPKAGLLGMVAARLASVPIRLHTVGGMPLVEAKGIKRKILEWAEKLTYQNAHKIYPNSFGLLDVIIENGLCPESKLKVIANGSSNGINIDFFSPNYSENIEEESERNCNNLGIDNQDFVFLFVGRLAIEKGIGELVEAFNSLLEESNRPLKLLLIGPYEKSYGVLPEALRKSIDENPFILTPGRFDDVRPYYALSNAFVFPTYREGFPNTLLEASAMELAIIATDINGCNEIVENGTTGFLIPPKNIEALKTSMKNLLLEEHKLKEMGKRGRIRIQSLFSREVVWHGLLAEYNYYLSKK